MKPQAKSDRPRNIGERVRRLREALAKTQHEVAVDAGLSSAQHVALIESGQRKPNGQTCVGLALALNTTTDYLLTGKHPN